MPGENRSKEQQIAENMLRTALQGYALVPQKFLDDQTALINELTRRFFKKPSVFRSLNGILFSSTYSLVGSDESTVIWNNILGGGNYTVAVFPIDDADEVDIAAVFTSDQTVSDRPNFFLAYALSSQDQTTPIPANQFALVKKYGAWGVIDAVNGNAAEFRLWDTIPCAGQRYIHIFGGFSEGTSQTDFIETLGQLNVFMTLSLKK